MRTVSRVSFGCTLTYPTVEDCLSGGCMRQKWQVSYLLMSIGLRRSSLSVLNVSPLPCSKPISSLDMASTVRFMVHDEYTS